MTVQRRELFEEMCRDAAAEVLGLMMSEAGQLLVETLYKKAWLVLPLSWRRRYVPIASATAHGELIVRVIDIRVEGIIGLSELGKRLEKASACQSMVH